MKLANWLPSLFTFGNLSLGFLSIVETMRQNYETAAFLIFVCLLLDTLDGRLARKLNTANDFGLQLDSLADLVSFGVAPAVFAMEVYMNGTRLFGILASILFVLAVAGRLARFNMLPKTSYFIGLPSPTAGVAVVGLYLAQIALTAKQTIIIMLLLSFLMISMIKYPKFNIVLSKPREYFKTHAKSRYFAVFLIGLGILAVLEFSIDPNKLILLPFLYYIIVGPIVALKN